MTLKVSPKVEMIKYAIRDIVVTAKEVEQNGKQLYYFNIGDPNKFDFDTPDFFKKALISSLDVERANAYSDSAGVLSLREAICKRQKQLWSTSIVPENVLITTGASEAISFLAASFQPNSEVLVPSPVYPTYISYLKFHNINPVEYNCSEENNWFPDTDNIRSLITDKTQAILLINPNNPTGAVYPPKIVKEICDIAGENNLLIISDEIYDLLTWDSSYKSTSSLTDLPVLELNGISKTLLSPGWRLGWAILKDEENQYNNLWDALAKQSRIRLCANTPIQIATSQILNYENKSYLNTVIPKLKNRAEYFTRRINECSQLSVVQPSGAFYAFPKINVDVDDRKFVIDLLKETGVLFVFGSGFGQNGKKHFRSVILPNLQIMETALDLVENYLNKRY